MKLNYQNALLGFMGTLLVSAGLYASDCNEGLFAYIHNGYLKVVTEEGREIVNEFSAELLNITDATVSYRKNGYLKVVNHDGKEIVSQFGAQIAKPAEDK